MPVSHFKLRGGKLPLDHSEHLVMGSGQAQRGMGSGSSLKHLKGSRSRPTALETFGSE